MDELRVGLTGRKELTVEERHTASHLGSGGVPVYATPMMVLAMEEAALSAVDPLLGDGRATVGVSLDVRHLAATPLGMRVTASAELMRIDGRMLTFRVEARDEAELIGEGTHVRAVVDLERFKDKLAKKASRP
ncbi:MAG TPA: thioesterase family protein [Spirochaetia bacterium]|nr:thioesterase family protein [Spirochaetales bacterium]HRW24322.1 thioesterase family protein [Spirochaetia bacterium]